MNESRLATSICTDKCPPGIQTHHVLDTRLPGSLDLVRDISPNGENKTPKRGKETADNGGRKNKKPDDGTLALVSAEEGTPDGVATVCNC